MLTTPIWGIQYPEATDRPDASTDYGRFARRTDDALEACKAAGMAVVVSSPTPSADWDWWTTHGTGVAMRYGNRVSMSGSVKRTGLTFTPSGFTIYPYLTLTQRATSSFSQTGLIITSSGVGRWFIDRSTPTVLNLLNAGGFPALGAITQNTGWVSCTLTYVGG